MPRAAQLDNTVMGRNLLPIHHDRSRKRSECIGTHNTNESPYRSRESITHKTVRLSVRGARFKVVTGNSQYTVTVVAIRDFGGADFT